MITISAFAGFRPSPRAWCATCACVGRWRRRDSLRRACWSRASKGTAAYRALQPFGQVPYLAGRRVRDVRERGDRAAHRRPLAGPGAVGSRGAAADAHLADRGAQLGRAGPPEPDPIDLFHADEAWAKARRPGAEAFAIASGWRPGRLAGRPRLSFGRPLHRRRPDDDHRAAHPAPDRPGDLQSGAGRLCPPLRGPTRRSSAPWRRRWRRSRARRRWPDPQGPNGCHPGRSEA
jgi:hypothetical protein